MTVLPSRIWSDGYSFEGGRRWQRRPVGLDCIIRPPGDLVGRLAQHAQPLVGPSFVAQRAIKRVVERFTTRRSAVRRSRRVCDRVTPMLLPTLSLRITTDRSHPTTAGARPILAQGMDLRSSPLH